MPAFSSFAAFVHGTPGVLTTSIQRLAALLAGGPPVNYQHGDRGNAHGEQQPRHHDEQVTSSHFTPFLPRASVPDVAIAAGGGVRDVQPL
jgi:hypothetical protein